MAFLPAGVIDGARTYAETVRRVAYAATSGVTGVTSPDALTVTQTATASGSVVIAPGGASIASTYPGAVGQSYSVFNDSAVTVAVPGNSTGSTVTFHVMVTIRDPQYPGMPTPASPETDLYMDVVISATFPTDRPYLWLADIARPSGAATITNAMVTDKRALGRPNYITDGYGYYPVGTKNMPTSAYGDWPQVGVTVDIPSWATWGMAEWNINGVAYTGSDTGVGGVRCTLAGGIDPNNGIIRSVGQTRQSLFVLGKWIIGSSLRGTTQPLVLQGLRSSGTGQFTVDYQSQICVKWTFTERR